MTKPTGQLDLLAPTDTRLNQAAAAIDVSEIALPHIQNVIDQMLTLAAGKGHGKDTRQMVGLAAPQLGVSKRIISVDLTADGSHKKQTLQVVINPQLTAVSTQTVPGREGCWSCGSICGQVERAQHVTLSGLDRTGKPVRFELHGFVARIAQHEADHLEGIRFPDRIPTDEPEHLHWVKPEQFADYRTQWMHWQQLCPRERWEAMKAGKNTK